MVYCVFLADWGEREHVFSPVRVSSYYYYFSSYLTCDLLGAQMDNEIQGIFFLSFSRRSLLD
jgi:hypothetical protein